MLRFQIHEFTSYHLYHVHVTQVTGILEVWRVENIEPVTSRDCPVDGIRDFCVTTVHCMEHEVINLLLMTKMSSSPMHPILNHPEI